MCVGSCRHQPRFTGNAVEGTFRADLFYRLNAFTIYVPPLRQRSDDIPALVKHFINNHDFSRRVNKHLSEVFRSIFAT